MDNVNKRLKNLRAITRKTQTEISRDMNVSTQLVSKWECSDTAPSTEDIIRLSEYYKVSVDYLLKGESNIEDKKVLKRILSEDEIAKDLKNEIKNLLKNTKYKEYVDSLIEIARIPKKISVLDDISSKISFDINDVLKLNTHELYLTIKENYKIDGYEGKVNFGLLWENDLLNYNFYREACENDAENINDALHNFTAGHINWEDEIVLLLLNNGGVITKVSYLKEHVTYSGDACANNHYEEVYEKDIATTLLLKDYLKKKLNK